eukprot:CAMPEP_0204604308 /NCGR_PEP_ID=MMETSP0661-20131031/57779_1 /ASSEMBLY_ACC=CAM_ASM_000606 /TAXON_ID=109239 /ORGANISM="Alexandrium margalefi, Strain AMGDE01CS-322" /LENGTH=240 /DNA_ID=CAMNT_0051615449 /DNA_START=45 /DNA_END=768 /DNA_ORIENTATION=+
MVAAGPPVREAARTGAEAGPPPSSRVQEMDEVLLQVLDLALHDLHVQAARLALQMVAAVQELVDADLARVVVVQELEEGLGVADVQLQRVEVRDDLLVVQPPLELCQGDAAGVVLVHCVEKLVHGAQVGLLRLHLLVHDDVLVYKAALHSRFDEDACHNVDDAEHGKRDVDQEQLAVNAKVGSPGLRSTPPVVAAGHRHEERQDGPAQRAEVQAEVLRRRVQPQLIAELEDGGGGEGDAE